MDFLHGPALRPSRPTKPLSRTLLFSSPHPSQGQDLSLPECRSTSQSHNAEFDDSSIAIHRKGSLALDEFEEASCAPGDSDREGGLAHEILWDHFGFIPCSQGLDGEGYKQRVSSPCFVRRAYASGRRPPSWKTRVCAALCSRGRCACVRSVSSFRERPITPCTRSARLYAFKREALLTRSVFSVPIPSCLRPLARARPIRFRPLPSPPLAYLPLPRRLLAPEHGQEASIPLLHPCPSIHAPSVTSGVSYSLHIRLELDSRPLSAQSCSLAHRVLLGQHKRPCRDRELV